MGSDNRPRIKLRSAVLTDIGNVRDHNEDSAHVDEGECFFIVADGMGGHAAGEVASAMAVDTVREALDEARPEIASFAAEPDDEGRKAAVNVLEAAVRAAHQAVYSRGIAETDKQGMGTTLDVVLVAGPEAFVAHVGDSRTYLIRDGRAAQITTDHTVAEVLVIEGKLSLEEAQISPLRTILVNAIGVAPDVGVEMAHVQLRKDDRLLICSDGLHDYFPVEQELADHMVNNDPETALATFIDLAKERGGHDNITGVILHVLDCDAPTTGGNTTLEWSEDKGSDGIPAPIDNDDTMPVDIEDLTAAELLGPNALRQTDPDIDVIDPLDVTLDASPPGADPIAIADRRAGESGAVDDGWDAEAEAEADTVDPETETEVEISADAAEADETDAADDSDEADASKSEES
jgi:serine/threonine protein phosphatase PrpC